MIVAPAASGKTEYVLQYARNAARKLSHTPWVILPTRLQAASWQQRLARAGGALGIHVGTFDDLYSELLNRAGVLATQIPEPVQKRLLRSLMANLDLIYFKAIQNKPGFIELMWDVIRELKAGGITPSAFLHASHHLGEEQRLMEMGEIYRAYQDRLQHEKWMDYVGAGWLTLEALQGKFDLQIPWSPIIVDGFDDFTPIQIRILSQLADRVPDILITLTGDQDRRTRQLVHKRFLRTRESLEQALEVEVEHLEYNEDKNVVHPVIRTLERSLFRDGENGIEENGAVQMIAAPDREGEVRHALRWLKNLIVAHNWDPSQTGVFFRHLEPYRPFLQPIASEFGLPLHLEAGQPLGENPLIASILNLLRVSDPEGEYLSWRETVESWRSPYFRWSTAYLEEKADQPIGIKDEDAEVLAWVASWGNVIQGWDQWRDAFELLITLPEDSASYDEEYPDPPDRLPRREEARGLWDTFERFTRRIQPPAGSHLFETYISWIEDLIGEEEESAQSTGLHVVQCVKGGPERLQERDLEALRQLKEVLRGLLWAERAVGARPVSFHEFLQELLAAVEGATFRSSSWEKEEGVLAADVVNARGIPLKAVALIGMGEGEFPQTIQEDPFLRDGDRAAFNKRFGLPLSPSTESWEGEYFYEGITRASRALLLTRSRIADNGAPWQPSPYWEEIDRRLKSQPQLMTSQSHPPLEEAASGQELLESICTAANFDDLWPSYQEVYPDAASFLQQAYQVLRERDREGAINAGEHDGNLNPWADTFASHFDEAYIWSASRLEGYQTCPYFFFTDYVLDLEPWRRPQEGLDARQLGNIYHLILEKLYRAAGDKSTLAQLQKKLPEIADDVLDQAPRREGFRETAWWTQTREEIKDDLMRSLAVLERLNQNFTFHKAEKTFGIADQQGPPLKVEIENGGYFLLRGYIDRVDRDPEGKLRIIDYKTSAPYAFHNRAVREGKKLQLPLYALAAERALDMGPVREGFYFHVRHAEPSRFRMSRYDDHGDKGPAAAMERAKREAWKAVQGAREGKFMPRVPENNCPDYCPAAGYCWHYTPRKW